MQVDPLKPMLKAPGTKRLKLRYDEPLSNFAFKINLRRYSEVYDWLRNTFVPIWADPQCGDGECEDQTEYPGFGRFGCTADCGRACQMMLATS